MEEPETFDCFDRRDFRAFACLIAFFNTLDSDESIREADKLTAKFFGDPVQPETPKAEPVATLDDESTGS